MWKGQLEKADLNYSDGFFFHRDDIDLCWYSVKRENWNILIL